MGEILEQEEIKTVNPATDVISAQDYYRKKVEVENKDNIYQQYRNQNISQVIDAAKNIAKNENMAIESFERSKYQTAQTMDKSGWGTNKGSGAGGYALDSNRQLEYLRSSIQADILSQKQLQALGYKTSLASAIAATELQADQLALERYRQARQDAAEDSERTGYYVEPHIADMVTQAAAMDELIKGGTLSEEEKVRYEKALEGIKSKLTSVIKARNAELKAQGVEDYQYGTIDENGQISVLGIKTMKRILEEADLRYKKATIALQEYEGEIKRVEAEQVKLDLYEKKDADGNIIYDSDGNIIYGSRSQDQAEALNEAKLKEIDANAESIKASTDFARVKTNKETYDPIDGYIIPRIGKDGKHNGYTNALPTSEEEIKALKEFYAGAPGEFKKLINYTMGAISKNAPRNEDGTYKDFGAYFEQEWASSNMPVIIEQIMPDSSSEAFNTGSIELRKTTEKQTVYDGDEQIEIPAGAWVIIDKETNTGFCYINSSTGGGDRFAFSLFSPDKRKAAEAQKKAEEEKKKADALNKELGPLGKPALGSLQVWDAVIGNSQYTTENLGNDWYKVTYNKNGNLIGYFREEDGGYYQYNISKAQEQIIRRHKPKEAPPEKDSKKQTSKEKKISENVQKHTFTGATISNDSAENKGQQATYITSRETDDKPIAEIGDGACALYQIIITRDGNGTNDPKNWANATLASTISKKGVSIKINGQDLKPGELVKVDGDIWIARQNDYVKLNIIGKDKKEKVLNAIQTGTWETRKGSSKEKWEKVENTILDFFGEFKFPKNSGYW